MTILDFFPNRLELLFLRRTKISAIMDDQKRAKYEDQSLQLRAELKQFEADYAQNHDGKKPPREVIKQNPDIGMSYRMNCFDLF